MVNAENNRFPQNTKNPIARIVSANHPDMAVTSREDASIGLPAVLNLAIGGRVMLQASL